MVLGYGHDDRSCAYPSLIAQLDTHEVERTAVTVLADKEEIGSRGATGMTSRFFENTIAEILELADEGGSLALRRCLTTSRMLSSDVSAAYDPNFPNSFETKNSAFMGHGLAFNKYTGSGGKGNSNDADAEYIALIRRIMDDAGIAWQTAELGRVDAGGGGICLPAMACKSLTAVFLCFPCTLRGKLQARQTYMRPIGDTWRFCVIVHNPVFVSGTT